MPVKSHDEIAQEFAHAERAMASGNEGMARVCARRATGWSIQVWLNNKGIDLGTPSAFDYIQHMREQPDTPDKVMAVLDHMVAKAEHAEGSDEHVFPVDLNTFLDEARWLCEQMLGEPLPLN